MTYGEYNYLVKHKMKLKDGIWVVSKPSTSVPTRMSRKDAAIYYTLKFREYWESKV